MFQRLTQSHDLCDATCELLVDFVARSVDQYVHVRNQINSLGVSTYLTSAQNTITTFVCLGPHGLYTVLDLVALLDLYTTDLHIVVPATCG